MADILLTMPPITGGTPSISLQETPHALGSYQVTFELNNVSVTFQGTLEALVTHFQTAHEMLQAFTFPPTPRRSARPYEEQARINTRRWGGR